MSGEVAVIVLMAAVSFQIVRVVVGGGWNGGTVAATRGVVPSSPLPLRGAAVLGSNQARLGMVIFSDFECPFCRRFALETLPVIKKEYVDSGKLLIAFRHWPLETIHSHARAAAVAASCAAQEGKFWGMHDLLFADQRRFDRASLRTMAEAAGVDGAAFTECVKSPSAAQVEDDIAEGKRLNVSGTPTIYVGHLGSSAMDVTVTNVLSGAKPASTFEAVLDGLLSGRSWPRLW